MVTVLTYNKPHRKTQDVLFGLKALGYDNVAVFELEWEERKKRNPLFPHRPESVLPVSNSDLCKNLNYHLNH